MRLTLRNLLLLLVLVSLPAWSARAADPGALFIAAEKGSVIPIRKALAAGVDVDAADPDGWTALMIAASGGKAEAVEALAKAGANINHRSGKGETPLMAAVLSGNPAVAKYLLDHGADPGVASVAGMTAADIARRSNDKAMLGLFAKAEPATQTRTQAVPARNVAARTDQAAQAFQAGDYNRAASLFREVVAADPKNALAWHFLGQSLTHIGDLMGARKAYQRALEVAPAGSEVSDRTQAMLAKLPLPYPASISLPSGLTLYDEMNNLDRRVAREPTITLFENVSRMLAEYGPYPKLREVQRKLLQGLQPILKVGNFDEAKAALPMIQRLRGADRSNLDLLRLEAAALHRLGRHAEAKADYAEWLRLAGP